MNKIYTLCMAAFVAFSFQLSSAQDLILTGVIDGPLSGGTPKAAELYVVNDIPDLSIYGIGSANNGGGSSGVEYAFSGSATAGSFLYIASESTQFNNFFGFAPDFTDGALNINGDDAIEVFQNGNVIDVFGDINTDGTGEPWEHLDGWAYRVDATGPDGSTFVLGNWFFSGPNALDGESDNATAATPFPVGTYQLVNNTPTAKFTDLSASMTEGDAPMVVSYVFVDPAVTNASSLDIEIQGGSADQSDLNSPTFPVTFNYTDAGPDSVALTIDVNDDAVYEGTETISFVLRNEQGDVVLGSDSVFTLTIMDNELPPDTVVSFSPTEATISEGAGTVTVGSVVINQLSAGTTFSVDVMLTSGDAADIDNYTTQTVQFAPGGSTSSSFDVTLTDDMVAEGAESFTFVLTNASAGLELGVDSVFTLTISDNDLPVYTIAEVTSENNSDLEADSSGVRCIVHGTVISQNFRVDGMELFIHDGVAGIAVFTTDTLFNDVYPNPLVGDSISVAGTVSQFQGLTEMLLDDAEPLDTIQLVGVGTVPDTLVATVLDESTEGELVRLNGVELVSALSWDNSNTSGFSVEVTDGTNTYELRIDNSSELYNEPAPTGTFDIVGVGSQRSLSAPYDDGYRLLPRFATDLFLEDVVNPSIRERAGVFALDVYPNPTTDRIMVQSDELKGEGILRIIDITGNVHLNQTIQLSKSFSVEVGDLSNGHYILEILSDTKQSLAQFMIAK